MPRSMLPWVGFAILFVAFLAAHPAIADAEQDVLLRAMSAELKRSFEGLGKLEGPPLYYLAYQARDQTAYGVTAQMGALVFEGLRRDRTFEADVRVGTPQLDNTHQIKGRGGRYELPSSRYRSLAVHDDADALRADMWRRTDRAYKAAVDRYTAVHTNLAVMAREEDRSADFSEAEPVVFYETVAFPELDEATWRERVRRISAATKSHPDVFDSSVNFSVETENRYLVNTEGSRVVTGNVFVRLTVQLDSQTDDGMELQRARYYDAERPEDLPEIASILADVETAARELKALRAAPVVDPYTGPAIFRHRATGVFFHEILGHRLEGHRQKLEGEGQTFTKMVGKPIVADFISVYDDPTRRTFEGQFLRGYYRFDDEGVAPTRLALVRHGVLANFLMSRSPIAGFGRSNGHGRRSAGRFIVARMGNTMVEAAKTVPYATLRQMLLEELVRQDKPHGLIFDDISGGFTSTGRAGTQSFKVIPRLVYRVFADGRPDEVVRGVDIVGTPLTSFGKIIAAADDYDVFNGTCGAESGWVPVSAVAPSILVSEIEIEKQAKSSKTPPILLPPHHAGDSAR